jgi:hypothetical protein
MEYTLYKTETFIIDVVIESGKCLLERVEIMDFLNAEGYLTQCGSSFEIDLLDDLLDNVNWTRIKKEIKDSSVWDTDEEIEEIEESGSEVEID